MRVLIPSSLRSYTEKGETEAAGATLAAVLADLENQYPGIRFRVIDEQDRIRRHIRIFVNGEQARDLAQALRATDEVIIVQALSGGPGQLAARSPRNWAPLAGVSSSRRIK